MGDTMERKRFSSGHYAGNKWGGKYLRTPEIFKMVEEMKTFAEKELKERKEAKNEGKKS